VRTPTDKKGKEVEGSWAKVDHVLLGNSTYKDPSGRSFSPFMQKQ